MQKLYVLASETNNKKLAVSKIGKLCTSCFKIGYFARCLNCDLNSIECDVCHALYKSFEEFKCHFKSTHRTHDILHSSDINEIFSALVIFKGKFKSTIFICPVCLAIHNNAKDLLIHATRIHVPKKYQCNECGRKYRNKNSLRKHVHSHLLGPLYECDICEKRYHSYHSLKCHILSHLNNQNYKCKLCDKTFNEVHSLTRHIKQHSREKLYKCKVCLKAFSYNFTLKRHYQEMHTKLPSYICDICGVTCKRKGDINRHIKEHANAKMYKCPVCKKGFPRKTSADVHQLKHSNAKMFMCFCGKTFKFQSSLSRHKVKHEND